MVASNTHDCFREFVGHTVKGVLFDALPLGRPSLSGGNKTLIFDDGRGLTFGSNGSFWIDSKGDIQVAIAQRTQALRQAKDEIAEVLAVAGALDE